MINIRLRYLKMYRTLPEMSTPTFAMRSVSCRYAMYCTLCDVFVYLHLPMLLDDDQVSLDVKRDTLRPLQTVLLCDEEADELAVVRHQVDAVVPRVGDDHMSVPIDAHAVGVVELARSAAVPAVRVQEGAVSGEHLHLVLFPVRHGHHGPTGRRRDVARRLARAREAPQRGAALVKHVHGARHPISDDHLAVRRPGHAHRLLELLGEPRDDATLVTYHLQRLLVLDDHASGHAQQRDPVGRAQLVLAGDATQTAARIEHLHLRSGNMPS